MNKLQILALFSDSCLIDEDGKSFLLISQSGKVSRYNMYGWVEDLNDLSTSRSMFGCTRFINNKWQRVNLVCYGDYEGTCEMNIAGTSTWQSTPPSIGYFWYGMTMVTWNNRVFMMGKLFHFQQFSLSHYIF